ncbi:MAG: type I-MYXAN CRISPR-associated endonuclease Cas1 [Deltaproteobacteria bacterium]|nr:type I-MYXAN CRISPR-associated endonuclease Cas1 [Deltaproteobacteria bacterium]
MHDRELIRVMALHALAYCERLFYLEEVEEIRVADAAVWAGRRMHAELEEPEEVTNLTLESERLGIRGRVDAVRRRDGSVYPIEHKRGRCRRDLDGAPQVWDSDELQVAAYAMLLEEHLGTSVTEGRVRYHHDNLTVRVAIGEPQRRAVHVAVARARELAGQQGRPPVTPHEGRCARCSLAPVCLPEEGRFVATGDAANEPPIKPIRLFPADTEKRSLHVLTHGARVGRSGDTLVVAARDAPNTVVGMREVSDVVLHGFAQISTQALRSCAAAEVPVHLVTTSGAFVGSFAGHSGGVQRRLRQFRALADDATALALARRLIVAKLQMQIQHLMRASRGKGEARAAIDGALGELRAAVRGAAHAGTAEALMGHEGHGARGYFGAVAELVVPEAGASMRPGGRSKHPPLDRFNALLSFGYSLLYRDVLGAALRVGLEPAFGLLHRPRSAAYPLVLDVMELFRVSIVDIAVLGAVNRRTFDEVADFAVTGRQVWLSDEGRRKLIEIYERRKHQEYRHPVLGYTLSYARMIELELRLLEKEWSDEAGLFATFRIR